jgi:hypothetical protein
MHKTLQTRTMMKCRGFFCMSDRTRRCLGLYRREEKSCVGINLSLNSDPDRLARDTRQAVRRSLCFLPYIYSRASAFTMSRRYRVIVLRIIVTTVTCRGEFAAQSSFGPASFDTQRYGFIHSRCRSVLLILNDTSSTDTINRVDKR